MTPTQKENCELLINILSLIQDDEFDPMVWAHPHQTHTRGDAMGWAAMSGRFGDALAYCVWDVRAQKYLLEVPKGKYSDHSGRYVISPVINGVKQSWPAAGSLLFGEAVEDALCTAITRNEAIAILEKAVS